MWRPESGRQVVQELLKPEGGESAYRPLRDLESILGSQNYLCVGKRDKCDEAKASKMGY